MSRGCLAVSMRWMQEQDVPAGMRLKTLAGWNQTDKDWRLFLTAEPPGTFVAEHEGEAIGTAATLNYQDKIGWIGMVLVDPRFRGQGVGQSLLEKAMTCLKTCRVIKLDATALGKKLYERVGFKEESVLHRLVGKPMIPVLKSDDRVTPLRKADVKRIAEFDRAIFGADRAAVLAACLARAPRMAWKLEKDRKIAGFCLGRDGTRYEQLGPIVAVSAKNALQLAQTAMAQAPEGLMALDVPASQQEFIRWLCRQGFSKEREFIRMSFGESGTGSIHLMQFAICGPEFG